ncbi:MAG: hypothetical protein H0T42_07290 [Deltaproteobacteria bacterium]|nr:hypothetical protein [Deltaproteobacteria bacterium]
MKLTNLAPALFMLAAACGVVVDPGEDPAPPSAGPTFEEPAVGREIDEPAVPSPLLIDAPRAATTAGSLFAMTFAAGAPIGDILDPTERTRIDVIEQKFVTVTDQDIELSVELAPPTGSYTRTLVSDTLRNGGTFTDHVLCESNNITTYDPRCETATPLARELPSFGPLTAARWKLTVVDDVTGVPLASCITPGTNTIRCVLPGRASASYRIIASAHGFADLWDGSAGFGPFAMAGIPFFGAFAPQSDWLCWDWRVSGTSMWCAARYEYVRFTAIDRARLDFDPITVRITANGSALAMASPALSWDPGNDDLPGPY